MPFDSEDQAVTRTNFTFPAQLLFEDGQKIEGLGFGCQGSCIGELVFNTAMTGYQEILTDPSYAGQIITFTQPHIGNVGCNFEDEEAFSGPARKAALGMVCREFATLSSNWRAKEDLEPWMKERGLMGIANIDTRALTHLLCKEGAQKIAFLAGNEAISNSMALLEALRNWPGLEGKDLAPQVTSLKAAQMREGLWELGEGFTKSKTEKDGNAPLVIVIDYGLKTNILRNLVSAGASVKVLPAQSSAEDIMALQPDGILLSNGPGDPAATARYAVPVIQTFLAHKLPIFGICLGHQLLGLALGGKTIKMHQGHHGANHPVLNLRNGKVEIVSMNHGFTLDEKTLPTNVEASYRSLFDDSNCGIRLKNANVSSVQHHPEASPGPQDSFGLFTEFVERLRK